MNVTITRAKRENGFLYLFGSNGVVAYDAKTSLSAAKADYLKQAKSDAMQRFFALHCTSRYGKTR